LIPFNIGHSTISLIISDPTDIALLEEISFLLGMDVKPFIAPDLWIEHLLCKHYRVEPSRRYEELFSLIRNKGFELRTADAIRKETGISEGERPKSEVKKEEYTPLPATLREEKKAEGAAVEEKVIYTDIVKPYTYTREEALEDLKNIKDRDAIMFFALKYAYQYFDFCAILIFQKDKAKGFSFLGSDRSIESDFRTLELNLNSESIFRLVRETGAHFLGIMPMTGENEVFIKRLRRPFPPNVLVVPVTIAGKVIGLFYADNGESLVRGEDVPHILTFFHIVSNQLQELIRFLKFNRPQFRVVLKSRTEKGEDKREEVPRDTGEKKESPQTEADESASEYGSIPQSPSPSSEVSEIPSVQLKSDISDSSGKSSMTESALSEQVSPLTEDMVKELSQYVEPSDKGNEAGVDAAAEEKRETHKIQEQTAQKEDISSQKDEILKKEEEYRINLLLDTIEQSPNAINSSAYDQLIAEKEKALPYIAKRFPGKLKIDLLMQTSSDISDVEEHSNLIQLIVGIGREAIPFIAPLMKSDNHTIRFYAVFIFSKLRYPEAIPYLLEAIFDASPKISLVAIEVLNRYRSFPKFSIVLSRLRSELVSNDNDKVRIAALSLGQFKDLESVPQLIKLLSSKSESVRESALNSLRDICKEDLGTNPKDWTKWWQKHSKTPRILWMIEGLSHRDENIRYLSIEELRELTGEFFGYFYDAPKKERDRAVERWKEWWKTEGEKRFAKEG
ncbi:MAG: hypothetical protein N3B13_07900, partial [Deltaproteobacteria bacterium]|nr:hypothetical protein [Deltaproteobacteria bacterium]